MSSTKNFWNRISKNYDSSVQKKYQKTYDETIRLTLKYLKKDDTVLDFACGTGITTIELAPEAGKIIAIDISDKMIGIAKGKTGEAGIGNIEYYISDIYDEKLIKGSFQVLMAFNIIQFIKDDQKLMQRFYDLLAPEGLFISATDCYREVKSLKTDFLRLVSWINILPYAKAYSCKSLRSIIERNGFQILESARLYKDPVNYYIAARKESL